MINIVGLIIFALGFFAPHISEGRIPALPLFWVGGAMLLSSGVFIKPGSSWTRWARLGIIANVLFVALMLSVFYATADRPMSKTGQRLTMMPYWVAKPMTAAGQHIFPYKEFHNADGSIAFRMSFIRTSFVDFLDIAVFAFAGVGCGRLREMKSRR